MLFPAAEPGSVSVAVPIRSGMKTVPRYPLTAVSIVFAVSRNHAATPKLGAGSVTRPGSL